MCRLMSRNTLIDEIDWWEARLNALQDAGVSETDSAGFSTPANHIKK
jgi:hypothetical protein